MTLLAAGPGGQSPAAAAAGRRRRRRPALAAAAGRRRSGGPRAGNGRCPAAPQRPAPASDSEVLRAGVPA
jgi:hypothetical protein